MTTHNKYEDIVKLCKKELKGHANVFEVEDFSSSASTWIRMDWKNFFLYISKFQDVVTIYTHEYITLSGSKTVTAFYFVDGRKVFQTIIEKAD